MSNKRLTISPMVLLSAVDHYKRMSTNRVVAVLLGSEDHEVINITNSFAVPFEENNDLFYLDSSYLQNMYELFLKVNTSEKILGWYHTGPKMYSIDLEITKTFLKYCESPLMAIIDIKNNDDAFPVQMFKLQNNSFVYQKVKIGAEETEEVGIEHLLRNIKKGTGKSMQDHISDIHNSLSVYEQRLTDVINYVDDELNNNCHDEEILFAIQETINSVPKITKEVDLKGIYFSELVNTLISHNDVRLHNFGAIRSSFEESTSNLNKNSA